ncbi:hypothetical protein Pen02_32460 [Plantactinospora endophytica]|uniref:Uncharacterized protein n=1 Tax=Plantactinospora endophytica TaxID=673535 RepID=A0ABQ4E0T5_9ACTN|nr:hypothetical protein Pen02_32460 [Plantactinospora endophytica]
MRTILPKDRGDGARFAFRNLLLGTVRTGTRPPGRRELVRERVGVDGDLLAPEVAPTVAEPWAAGNTTVDHGRRTADRAAPRPGRLAAPRLRRLSVPSPSPVGSIPVAWQFRLGRPPIPCPRRPDGVREPPSR